MKGEKKGTILYSLTTWGFNVALITNNKLGLHHSADFVLELTDSYINFQKATYNKI